MSSIPPTTEGTEVELTFSGIDDADGVGIKDWDLYISTNKGPFTLYQANIDTAAYLFTGEQGIEYVFQTLASDYVGNQETLTEEGDTYTVFSEQSVISIITPESSNYCAGESIAIQWTSTETEAVSISLSTNGGVDFTTIASDLNPSEQLHNWSIPTSISCTDCVLQIKEASGTLEGTSPSFSISPIPELSFLDIACLLYTSPSPRDATLSRMPSSA